jgi:uncharacterized phiE125 gp8 family phage protein
MNRIISIYSKLQDYAAEPVTVTDLKLYLQIEGDAYDAQLLAYIKAARGLVEQATNISLTYKDVTTKATLTGAFRLPLAPVDAVGDVYRRKCPAIMEPMAEGYDYYLEGDILIPVLAGREWKIEYTTAAEDHTELAEAVKYQAGHLYTFRDDKTAEGWDSKAVAIVDAYKIGNY